MPDRTMTRAEWRALWHRVRSGSRETTPEYQMYGWHRSWAALWLNCATEYRIAPNAAKQIRATIAYARTDRLSAWRYRRCLP